MQGVDRSTRTAATDEDGVDHIGTDTPRSGIATPQPDLQDKRLPGIMSYFGQVRQDPSASEPYSSVFPRPESAMPLDHERTRQSQAASSKVRQSQGPVESSLRCSRTSLDTRPPLQLDSIGLGPKAAQQAHPPSHPYPTPPASQPSSSGGSMTQDSSLPSRAARAAVSTASCSAKLSLEQNRRPDSTTTHSLTPDTCSEAETATAQGGRPASPQHREQSPSKHPPPDSALAATSSKWYSLEGLKGLTRGVIFKSGPPTPTRALSAAHSSQSDGKDTPGRTSNDGADTSGTQTPRTSAPAGAQAPTPKGKLTIKIAEARGLRKCRDPYVVVVFQRSELISAGPRHSEEDDSLNAPTSAFGGIGGIPIQRQGSDSGRPVAIPMRSRQSSNTSITDYNTFRNRTSRAPSSNPKWDAEAVLYDSRSSHALGGTWTNIG